MKPNRSLSQSAMFLFYIVVAAFAYFPSAQAQATSSRAATVLDSMPEAKKVQEVAISPDGARLAYITSGTITVANLSDDSKRMITLENKLPVREIAWSSDSKNLAFIADLESDTPSAQVWTAAIDGNAPVKRAELKGNVQTPRFSPDGSRLSVLFIENLPRVAGPLQPMTPLAGVIGESFYEQRISVIDLATNKLSQVTPKDVYVYEYDWTPDGTSWAATAAHGNGDANWWVAHLYRIDAQSGEMHDIYKPKWQIADPHVSPDGKNVALIEGLMSDAGLTGGEIQLIPLAGGAAKNLTPGISSSPSALTWTSADKILFTQNADGDSSIATVNIRGGAAEKLWSSEQMIGATSSAPVPGISVSRDGSVAGIVMQAANTPPEVWAGPTGKWKQITHINADVKPAWGESKKVHWMNGKTRIQGWLLFPKDYNASKSYPLVINVHGGPSWGFTSRWSPGLEGALSAMGYFVLSPNPRGSYGQGEAFTQGNVKDFGGGDYRDIMTGVDSLAKQFPIDKKRIGIRGHSYGGYMTMWAETQTNFAAAVAGAGLSDWLSYYGLNDIDEWMLPFFGASVYDDPAVYAKSDPMHFVKAVKTPTLILVGDRDGEVPMEQSVEWWHALQAMHVPSTLVVYANEGHMFIKPADARDYNLRTLEWFEQWFEHPPAVH
jgi:dipeptidyl aminopeptidase/acylaminoacyl peptidase